MEKDFPKPRQDDFEIKFAGRVQELHLNTGSKSITFDNLALLRDLDKLSKLIGGSSLEITIKPIKVLE